MTSYIIAGGSVATLLILAFIWVWIIDGIRAAFFVTGFTVAVMLGALGIVLFWTWIAGGFA